MHYALIDCENIAQFDISQLRVPRNSNLVFCIGATQKPPEDLISEAECYGYLASSIKGIVDGKNAMDFCLSAHLGRLAALNPDATFSIVSRDLGFEPLIDYLRSIGIRVSRLSVSRPRSSKTLSPEDTLRRNLKHTIKQLETLPSNARRLKRIADCHMQLAELAGEDGTPNDAPEICDTAVLPSPNHRPLKQTSPIFGEPQKSPSIANTLGLLSVNVPREPLGYFRNRKLAFLQPNGVEFEWDGVLDSQPAPSTQPNHPPKPSIVSRLKDCMRNIQNLSS